MSMYAHTKMLSYHFLIYSILNNHKCHLIFDVLFNKQLWKSIAL